MNRDAWWIRRLIALSGERYGREHGEEAVADAVRLIEEARAGGWWAAFRGRAAVAADLLRTIVDRRRPRRTGEKARQRRRVRVRVAQSGARVAARAVESWRSVRVAVRTLIRSPSFTAVTVITIALGMGANAAVFTVIDAALLRGLPYPEHEQLVVIDGIARSTGGSYPLGFLDVEEMKQRTRLLEGLSARTGPRSFNLVGREASENITGELATSGYFRTLRVPAVRGRTFSDAEDVAGIHAVAVVSHSLWRQWFAESPDVVGSTIDLDGRAYEVIGVMPEGFRGLTDQADVWLPLSMAAELYGDHYLNERRFRWMSTIARLSPGTTVEAVQHELDGLASMLAAEFPLANNDLEFRAEPLAGVLFGDLRSRLALLWAAAGFVLLIACANVANLFLVRGIMRAPETVLRAALGASRARIASGFLLEGGLVIVAGGVLGLVVAAALTGTLVRFSSVQLPSFVDVSVDGRVIAMMLAIVAAAAVIAPILPSWLAARFARPGELAGSNRGGTAGPRSGQVQGGLVIGQVALALMLLAGSALTLRGFVSLTRRDIGFDAANLMTMRMDVKAQRFRVNSAYWSLADGVLEAAAAVPGVAGVALAGPRIPTDGWNAGHVYIEDRIARGLDAEGIIVETHNVSPGYFDLLGISLAAGRLFGPQDRDVQASRPVLIVNRAFAERYWPGENAIGKRMRFGAAPDATAFEIAGIVDEVRDEGRAGAERPTDLDVYLPLFQVPPRLPPQLNLLVRTTADPATVLASIRERIHGLAPDLPLFDVKMMEERLAAQTTTQRFLVLLMALFAILSVVLAAVGIYGLMAYRVARQRRELGIRLALGALPADLVRMVFRRAAILTLSGVVIGVAGARWLARFLESALSGVSPGDPLSFVAAASVLSIVALVASLLPALRAARIDPLKSMARE